MKEKILASLSSPLQLEVLYRDNKAAFKREFNLLYPELQGNTAADFWHERLNYNEGGINWGSRTDLIYVIGASLIAGLVAKIPAFFDIKEELFYPRNISFVVFPFLMIFFAWKNKLSIGKMAVIAATTLASLLFINSLPDNSKSDTLVLSCVHLALFLWTILGFAFSGDISNTGTKRLEFLKYNGELIVMTALILISGGIMSAITVGLFEIIGFRIEKFYFQNVAVFGLAAAPIVGTYLTRTNPQLVGKVSPVIAKLFTPLVTVMLLVYLVAMAFANKNPYSDREFLMIFNALLIGVMAIIFFSVAEFSSKDSRLQLWMLLVLSVLTIIVNGVALSAILFRISEWGFTPNRTAVLGGNILILVNLLLVTARLFKVVQKRGEIAEVGNAVTIYLPIYSAWTVIVTFIFPLIFGFK